MVQLSAITPCAAASDFAEYPETLSAGAGAFQNGPSTCCKYVAPNELTSCCRSVIRPAISVSMQVAARPLHRDDAPTQ